MREQKLRAIDHDLVSPVNNLLAEKLTKKKLEQDKHSKSEKVENMLTPKIKKPVPQQLA